MKHKTQEEILGYIAMLEAGVSPTRIETLYGISKVRIKVLWERYKKYGIKGMDPGPSEMSSAEKLGMLRDIEANHLTLAEASLKYGVAASSIRYWKGILRAKGPDGLITRKEKNGFIISHMEEKEKEKAAAAAPAKRKRGRPRKDAAPAEMTDVKELLAIIKKQEKTIVALHAEIDYLKKVEALAQQKRSCQTGTRPRPSGV